MGISDETERPQTAEEVYDEVTDASQYVCYFYLHIISTIAILATSAFAILTFYDLYRQRSTNIRLFYVVIYGCFEASYLSLNGFLRVLTMFDIHLPWNAKFWFALHIFLLGFRYMSLLVAFVDRYYLMNHPQLAVWLLKKNRFYRTAMAAYVIFSGLLVAHIHDKLNMILTWPPRQESQKIEYVPHRYLIPTVQIPLYILMFALFRGVRFGKGAGKDASARRVTRALAIAAAIDLLGDHVLRAVFRAYFTHYFPKYPHALPTVQFLKELCSAVCLCLPYWVLIATCPVLRKMVRPWNRLKNDETEDVKGKSFIRKNSETYVFECEETTAL